jgi:hypothetical protein
LIVVFYYYRSRSYFKEATTSIIAVLVFSCLYTIYQAVNSPSKPHTLHFLFLLRDEDRETIFLKEATPGNRP